MNTITLLCSCTDRTGIVAAMTNFVAEYGGNIIDLDQHSDADRFFMRIIWEEEGFKLDRDDLPAALKIVAKKFDDMHWEIFFNNPRPKVAVFCSKEPHCLVDLLLRQQMEELAGDIVLVISNHNELRSITEHFEIRFEHLSLNADTKEVVEKRQQEVLKECGIDMIVLARYMQILTPDFVDKWQGNIINIHHSFLPAFVGAKPYHQAKERGVKVIGATAHYVSAELDQGPIISQGVIHVSHRDEVGDLIRKGRDIERQVLGSAVRLHLSRQVLIEQNRTIVFE